MLKNILLVFLIGISSFSMARYMGELRRVYRLRANLSQAQDEVAILTHEKQNLLQDIEKEKELNQQLAAKNELFKDNLVASNKKIGRLFAEKTKVEDDLEEKNARLAILKAENKALVEGRKRLYSENEQFKFKLSSIVELKKAIRELRAQRNSDPLIGSLGNRGYLTKNGRPTTVERVKIEVIPARTKE